MSEIGPTSVRSRRPWRISSCPAANGIICSSCAPSSTIEPDGTCSAMACCMEMSLDAAVILLEIFLTASPNRRAPFQESTNAFLRVFSFHQPVQIKLFSFAQAAVEIEPRGSPQRTTRHAQHGRAAQAQLSQQCIDLRAKLVVRNHPCGQP